MDSRFRSPKSAGSIVRLIACRLVSVPLGAGGHQGRKGGRATPQDRLPEWYRRDSPPPAIRLSGMSSAHIGLMLDWSPLFVQPQTLQWSPHTPGGRQRFLKAVWPPATTPSPYYHGPDDGRGIRGCPGPDNLPVGDSSSERLQVGSSRLPSNTSVSIGIPSSRATNPATSGLHSVWPSVFYP